MSATSAKQFIRPDVLAGKAYPVPDPSGLIKLDAMENPYALPEALQQGLQQVLAQTPLNRYPRPNYSRLKDALRRNYKIDPAAQIMLGNGSDELIDLIAKAVAVDGQCILAPEPGFVMYRMSSAHARVAYREVALRPDFDLDLPAMLQAIEQFKPAVVYLAYPNNPTGNCFNDQSIEAILRAAPGLVVLDEAYQPFAVDTWMKRLPEFPNMVVMRTVSKWGLAGIRLGYMAGHPDWIQEFEKLRPPYNINVLSEAAACYCLDHERQFDVQTQSIIQERERLFEALKKLPKVQAFPSRANFVLARFPDAAAVHAGLLQKKILVKSVSAMHPLLNQCLRLTAGSHEENTALIQALQELLAAS